MTQQITQKSSILNEMTEAVIRGDSDTARDMATKALEENIDPQEAIVDGLAKGMSIMSDKYENGEAFVPHLLVSSNAMYAGMNELIDYIKAEDSTNAKVVIGTVQGDVHDIGKNLVKTMLTASGFDAIDLGNDVPLDEFVETAKEKKADAISMSSLMTTTMDGMETVIDKLKEEGIRDSLLVMVGGAPVSEDFAEEIDADATLPDADSAADWLKDAVEELDAVENRWSEEQIGVARTKYRKELAKKGPKAEVDIGRETAKEIIDEYESIVPKFEESMTKAERINAAFEDKKVDRLPTAPLACGVSRKFVPCTYKEYSTDAQKYADCVQAGIKYFNMDTFVGLTDLCVNAADLGATVRYPEEDTPAVTGHLEDYDDLEIPDITEDSRAQNLINGNKIATEKAHDLNASMTALIEGPMVTLTQVMGASRVLQDLKENPDVVNKALDKCTDYVESVMDKMFDEGQPDNLCMVTLWTNNFILDEDEYMNSEGRIMRDRIAPMYHKYGKPVVIHNCSDVPHWDLINKWDTKFYSYTYYPDEAKFGSKSYDYLIPKYGSETMFAGEINPINLLDNSSENLQKIRNNIYQQNEDVLNTLKENGMQSKYLISTGCEVPPGAPCDTVTAITYNVAENGPELQKKIIG